MSTIADAFVAAADQWPDRPSLVHYAVVRRALTAEATKYGAGSAEGKALRSAARQWPNTHTVTSWSVVRSWLLTRANP